MTIDIEQAVRDFSNVLGLPPDLANVDAQSDKRGSYIRVLMAPDFLSRLAVPPTFKGYPVAVAQRPKRAA